MDDQMLNEFMAYLDARAEALELENKIKEKEYIGLCGSEHVQLCPNDRSSASLIFQMVCERLGVNPAEKCGYDSSGESFRQREIEYRGLKIYTFENGGKYQ